MVEHDLFVAFNVKFPDTKLNSPVGVTNCMRGNYQSSFLPNFGKIAVVFNIIQPTSCPAERSFSVVKTENIP